MNKIISIIGLLTITVSCGPKRLEIDGFEKYVGSFEDDAMDLGIELTIDNLIIKFENTKKMSPNVIGICYSGEATPVIHIDQEFWDNADEGERYSLMYHELGHCILHQSHRNDRKSVMNSYIVWDFDEMRDYYNRELFLWKTNSYPNPIFKNFRSLVTGDHHENNHFCDSTTEKIGV